MQGLFFEDVILCSIAGSLLYLFANRKALIHVKRVIHSRRRRTVSTFSFYGGTLVFNGFGPFKGKKVNIMMELRTRSLNLTGLLHCSAGNCFRIFRYGSNEV